MLLHQRLPFLRSLVPPEPSWRGTGAIRLTRDWRDRSLLALPHVAAQLAAGVPESDTGLLAKIGSPLYNQNGLEACVAYSTCAVASLDLVRQGLAWGLFDAAALYAENGGDGREGVDPRRVLKDVVENGFPRSTGLRARLVDAYAFAPQVPGAFRQALKAALAAGQPCVVAMLLPSPFGYESGMTPTAAYHQVCAVAYEPEWLWVLNSWGDDWPEPGAPGLGRVKWDFLEGHELQAGYCYAYTTTAAAAVISPPVLPPP